MFKKNNCSTSKSAKQQPDYYLLKSYLYLFMLINTLYVIICTGILYITYKKLYVFHAFDSNQPIPIFYIYIMMASAIISFACYQALLKWKKWPVWVLLGINIIGIPLLISMGGGIRHAIFSFCGYFILLGLLLMGGKKRAWDLLK